MSEKKTPTYAATELDEREVNLRIQQDGKTIKVDLVLTNTGRPNQMPFAAIDRQKKDDYLTDAINSVTEYAASKNIGGYSVDKVTGSGKGGANIQAVSLEFNSTAEANKVFSDPAFIKKLQSDFDVSRKQAYMDAAHDWVEGIGNSKTGGATIGYNGVNVKVSDRVAIGYYAENFSTTPGYGGNAEKHREYEDLIRLYDKRHGINRGTGYSYLEDEPKSGERIAGMQAPDHPLNRQYEQALKGANGDKDAAALAVQTISQTAGYKPDQDIAVLQGKNGQLIATQGQGDASLNVAVPQAKPGDFERISTQIAQQPQTTQVAQQQDQPERARTV